MTQIDGTNRTHNGYRPTATQRPGRQTVIQRRPEPPKKDERTIADKWFAAFSAMNDSDARIDELTRLRTEFEGSVKS